MKKQDLETKRLRLRQLALTDAEQVCRLVGNYEVAKTTLNIPHPYTLKDANDWIIHCNKNFILNRLATFAIVDKSTGQLIGAIDLVIQLSFCRAEVGYWIGQPFWRKGYATEALQHMIQFAFETIKLHKVFAQHFHSNPASGKVMEKAGMLQEGYLREHVLRAGKFYDSIIYGIINPNDRV